MNYVLHYMLEATRGGPTRRKLLETLLVKPQNANQLAEHVQMDYKTIQHHLKVLEQHQCIASINKGKYGAMYFVTDEIRPDLEETREQFGKTFKKKKGDS